MVSMTKSLVALITLVILVGLLCTAGCTSQPAITATGDNTTPTGTDASLFVYSGAGLKKPMTAIGEAFTGKYGIGVDYTFAGSGTLITQMELSRKGDVFIPAERRITGSHRRRDWSENPGTSPTMSR